MINDHSVTNQQTKSQDAIDWLLNYPLMVAEDVLFIKGQMSDIIHIVKCAKKEKEEMKRHSNWTGTIPHLRLIHCIVDDDNIKAAYLRSLKVMNKDELDGKRNSMTMCVDPWEIICQKWMDPDFNPTSVAYPDLHQDFRFPIPLTHCKVEKMLITADKAKDKFYEMKNILITVKSNWEESGNGDGKVVRVDTPVRQISKDFDVPRNIQQVNGNDKRMFLQHYSPTILYFWAICEDHNILNNVCQELNHASSYDSMDNSSFVSSFQKKKRKNVESPISTFNSPNMDIQDRNESTRILIKANDLTQKQLDVSIQQNISSQNNNIINCNNLILSCESKLMDCKMQLVDTEEGRQKSEILNENITKLNNRITDLNVTLQTLNTLV